MKSLFLFILSFIYISFNAYSAKGFTITQNSSGQNVSWPSPASPTFYANIKNASGLSAEDIFQAFTNSLSRWKNSGSANISYDYWQGSNSGTPTYYSYDGRNAVFFASQSKQKLGASTLAVTYVYSSSGTIVESDLEFNDVNFIFTTTLSDSTRFGDGSKVFLENVATHEFGHAYGLGHSAVLQSSMVYLEYREQYKPSCDDIQGIASLYPLKSFISGRGNVTGNVQYNATNVFGAHVLAISKTRGTVVTSAITDSKGQYSISNLEPGDYYLFFEPFQNTAYLNSLCGGSSSGCSYAAINAPTVCSGSPFKRGFQMSGAGDGAVQAITVSASGTVSAGAYSVSCAALTGGTTYTSIAAADAGTALLTNDKPSSAAKTFIMGGTGTDHFFKLSKVSGDISVKVIAYNLYSPFDAVVKLVDSDGVEVDGSDSVDNVLYNTSTTFKNYDSTVTLTGAATNDYYIKVTNQAALAKSKYPAGNATATQIDATKYYLLLVTIGDTTPLLPDNATPTLANNARCEADDTFTLYKDNGTPADISPSIAQSSSSTASSTGGLSGGDKIAGGCGIIQDINKDHNHFQGPGPSGVFSIWGMMMMMVFFRFFYSNIARLLASNRFRR